MRARVVVRADLADIGAYRQLSRALNRLVKEQKLARVGKGIYAKMRPSVISGKPTLNGAFTSIAREALDRLNVDWEPESAERKYNTAKSMQVPVNGRVKIKSRFSRKIAWGGMELQYEHNSQ